MKILIGTLETLCLATITTVVLSALFPNAVGKPVAKAVGKFQANMENFYANCDMETRKYTV